MVHPNTTPACVLAAVHTRDVPWPTDAHLPLQLVYYRHPYV